MIITPKYKNSIFEIIEEDEDLINLTDGDTYFIVWKYGEFQVEYLPELKPDGSLVLSTDTLIKIREKTKSNINIDAEDEAQWDKFWKTHTISHYVIKGGFNIHND